MTNEERIKLSGDFVTVLKMLQDAWENMYIAGNMVGDHLPASGELYRLIQFAGDDIENCIDEIIRGLGMTVVNTRNKEAERRNYE